MVGIQRISSKKSGKGGVMDYDFIFYHQSPSIEHSPISNQDI
jgi:hypothetical protein